MASAIASLSLEEFRARYAGKKPYYEYWFGEAVQKSVPMTSHGILQQILCALFRLSGYRTGSEIELRIDPDWQPKPDVSASIKPFESPYPTEPFDVAAEILSPDDPMSMVFSKCRNYARVGIAAIFVLDPESRSAWLWNSATDNLDRVPALQLPNGSFIELTTVWCQLHEQLN